jgi:signal transduction histidine kinase
MPSARTVQPRPARPGPDGTDAAALLDELERLRAELDAVKGQLEHQERLATLGTIASLIAHEFNNILTPVMSYAQMALGDAKNDPELSRKALSRALSGSERAAKIAGAILDFARDDGPTFTTRTPARGAGDGGASRAAWLRRWMMRWRAWGGIRRRTGSRWS